MSNARWKQVKRWPGWLVLGLVAVALITIGIARDSGPRTPEQRLEDISKNLACPICDGESVFESRNPTSSKIRGEIEQQLTEGRSDTEIITYIEQRYPNVLLVPSATGVDALVWIIPVAAAVCAVAGLAVAFRRWKRVADTTPTDEDRALVAAALEGDDEP